VNVAVARLEPTDGDVIWILNPDTEVPSGTVAALRNALADGWDVVSPQIITGGAEHPVVWFGGGDVDLRRGRTQHRRLGDPFAPAESLAPVACSFITGAAPMFTARAWRELGGLREDLFLYWEDADMSLRATGRGLRMAVVPGAVVWHARGGSSDDGHHSSVYYFYMQRNRMLVLRESGVSRGRLLLGPGGIETLRWSLRPLTEPRGRGGKLLASAKGLVAGLSAKITAKVPAAK
jgi:GT2 family glycosyltransferase